MSDNKKSGSTNVINALITLALFIIALIAWFQTRQLSNLLNNNWADPLAKSPALKLTQSTQNLTFLLWLVPLIAGIISLFIMANRSKLGDEGLYHSRTRGAIDRKVEDSPLSCPPPFIRLY